MRLFRLGKEFLGLSNSNGIFTISLDFELHYGVSDRRTVQDYAENLRNTPGAVHGMLKLFSAYGIHATWSTVGMLFCVDKAELLGSTPALKPRYMKPELSNFRLWNEIGNDVISDPNHYAWPLIEEVSKTPGQEIGTHTYSHFYCLEKGPTLEQFAADLKAAVAVGQNKGIAIRTIVFPRNQYSPDHLKICGDNGILAYRGTESHWLYATKSREEETAVHRAGRLLDAYLPLTSNTHLCEPSEHGLPLNVPASRFLRPVSSTGRYLESIRFRRIANEMTWAAKSGHLYHLWWHPHNFGKDLDKNLNFLENILRTFQELRNRFGMQSMNMLEVAEIYMHEQ